MHYTSVFEKNGNVIHHPIRRSFYEYKTMVVFFYVPGTHVDTDYLQNTTKISRIWYTRYQRPIILTRCDAFQM